MAPKAFFVCLPWVLPRHALLVRQAGNPYHFLAYTNPRAPGKLQDSHCPVFFMGIIIITIITVTLAIIINNIIFSTLFDDGMCFYCSLLTFSFVSFNFDHFDHFDL
ncbi:BEM_HP_G0093170.mRNA.1.CDS.1 [Saccharomyces cerevisiae]|nr:BEM_HP_G0150830.mRNA.1.CDS.1 [Saccharomyces cerevisiae]CAI4976518.1 BEM_HP_G0162790.mRNA.1.CDS.1 [Saccharomyces cerevisiae]CAI5190314.1 BEM_HP_G0093170.mRNA.1.CDS.1 [Saccharomyces cerevisiae]CAI6674460.1 BEM_HP_G0150830.mRNA.1.CDS.1 [Saccharomyces cerevisiae]CAI6783734.1 BEM_HP_G0162790.mRNA.1.CDS.1 [Saccharomyces cerevisiae]